MRTEYVYALPVRWNENEINASLTHEHRKLVVDIIIVTIGERFGRDYVQKLRFTGCVPAYTR